jgi:hypothetical protein
MTARSHGERPSRPVSQLLRRVAARKRTQAAVRGVALGLMLHALCLLTMWILGMWSLGGARPAVTSTWPTWLRSPGALSLFAQAVVVSGLALLCATALAWWQQRGSGGEQQLLAELEGHVPESRNLLRTAWELEQADASQTRGSARRSDAAAAQLVHERATALAEGISVARRWSFNQIRRLAMVSAALWMSVALLSLLVSADSGAGRATLRRVQRGIQRVMNPEGIRLLELRVTPPAYTGQRAETLLQPEQVSAIEGSLLELRVETSADTVVVHTDSGTLALPRQSDGGFAWRGRVLRDGFLAVSTARTTEVAGGTAAQPTTRGRDQLLVAIVARPDARPVVRIREPGRDVLVDSSRRELRIGVEASDDLALRSLTLPYTRVAGAGERFTFTEGELPLNVSKTSATSWRASATLALSSLLQDPGDLVVYRARVTDTRPGTEAVESDAYIVERQPDGGMAAAGFALDPDEDRYAVSQQMVILKTERLIAARATMPAERFAAEARALAGEQRRVRAEFVFMTGGEFEQALVATEDGMDDLDETHEVESEGDLSAGRMANRGRAALLTAIRAMSRAALALGELDLSNGLRLERIALTNLQEAFARQRFLMRALSQREQLDEARRLTGVLDSVSRRPRAAVRPEPAVLRSGLVDVLSALTDSNVSTGMLAIRVLQLAPASREAREVSRWLQQADRARTPDERRAAIDSASLRLSDWLARVAPPAGSTTRGTRQ